MQISSLIMSQAIMVNQTCMACIMYADDLILLELHREFSGTQSIVGLFLTVLAISMFTLYVSSGECLRGKEGRYGVFAM